MNYFDKTYLCFITSDGDREAKDIFDEFNPKESLANLPSELCNLEK